MLTFVSCFKLSFHVNQSGNLELFFDVCSYYTKLFNTIGYYGLPFALPLFYQLPNSRYVGLKEAQIDDKIRTVMSAMKKRKAKGTYEKN